MTVSSHDTQDMPHPVDQRPPLGRLIILGLQHVLAMYAGAVAVPLIVGGALIQAGQFDARDLHHLVVADLFVAGIASVVQSVGLWRFGAKLPLMQGVSFVAVAPMISIGSEHGVTAIYGSVIVTGVVMILVAPLFAKIVRYFPPLVTGTIITVVGLSLLSVAAGWVFNGAAPESDRGTTQNFLLALTALVVVILIHRFAPPAFRSLAVLGGIIVGTVVGQFLGATDWSQVGPAEWVGVPTPFQFGAPTFEIASILTMVLVGLVIMTETTGDIIAIGDVVKKPVDGKTLSDGLRADGLSTVLGGIFNTFPYTAFAQNVGLVSLSRIASRFVVTAAGVILVLLGLLPKMGAVVTGIPAPVLGGAGVALFGMVTASGIRTLSTVAWNETRALIVGVSVAVAMLPSVQPGLYGKLPDELGMILDSGISAGAVVVIVLNLLLNRQDGGHLAPAQTDTEPPEKLGPTGDSESYEVVLNNSERAAAWAERKAAEARVAVAEARDAQVRAAQIRAAEGSR
jgi:xanthine permease